MPGIAPHTVISAPKEPGEGPPQRSSKWWEWRGHEPLKQLQIHSLSSHEYSIIIPWHSGSLWFHNTMPGIPSTKPKQCRSSWPFQDEGFHGQTRLVGENLDRSEMPNSEGHASYEVMVAPMPFDHVGTGESSIKERSKSPWALCTLTSILRRQVRVWPLPLSSLSLPVFACMSPNLRIPVGITNLCWENNRLGSFLESSDFKGFSSIVGTFCDWSFQIISCIFKPMTLRSTIKLWQQPYRPYRS